MWKNNRAHYLNELAEEMGQILLYSGDKYLKSRCSNAQLMMNFKRLCQSNVDKNCINCRWLSKCI